MASKHGKNRKHTDKKQRQEVLQKAYYLASLVSVVVRLAFYLWDRFNH